MVPIQLTLEGVYSYKKKQSIDFVSLTKAGVFGIFGSTGSGKSTIIESITYALYGKISRLDVKGLSYNLMNLQSNTLLIDFICSSEITHCEYRFIVEGKRNSKNFSNISKFSRKCYKKINEDWIPIESSLVEQEVTGLSYDNFKRTVIIPQNHFLEFLHLGPKDRTQMMKEIFNLHAYELSDKTLVIRSKTKELLDNLKGKLQEIGEVSPEELLAIDEKITLVESQKQKTELIYKQAYSELEELKALAQDFEKLEKEKNKLTLLVSRNEEISNIEKRTNLIQYCLQNFDEHIRIYDNKLKEENDLLAQKEKLRLQLQSITQEYSITNKLFLNLESQFQKIEEFNKTTESIKNFSEAIQAKNSLETVIQRIEKGKKEHIKPQEELIIKLESELNILSTKKKNLLANKIDVVALNNKKTEQEAYNKILKEIEVVRANRIKSASNIKTLKAELHTLLDEYAIPIKSSSYSDLIKVKINALEDEVNQLNTAIQREQVSSEISFLHTHLENGIPCPVCGSKEHPSDFTPNVTTSEITVLQKKIAKCKAQQNSLSELQTKIALKQQSIQTLVSADKEDSNKMHELTIERNLTEPDNKIDLVKINEQIQEYSKQNNEREKLENNIEQVQLKTQQASKQLETYKNAIQELSNNAQKHETLYNLKIESCTDSIKETYSKSSIEELDTIIKSRIEETKVLREKYESTRKKNELLKSQKSEFEVLTESIKKQLVTLSEVLKETSKNIDFALGKSSFSNLDEIRSYLLEKDKLISYTKDVELHKHSLLSCKNTIEELSKKLNNKSYSEDIFKQKRVACNEKENAFKALQTEYAQLILKQTDYKKTIEKHKATLAEVEQVSNKLDNIKTLTSMFNGSGFVNFISTKYLRMLCEMANKRFAVLTKHALKLEIDDDNNSFKVRDYMNNGQIRDIKTLSGGQSFQAALSLALALSDSINTQSTASNFFFIDEGFGSQDKDSLQIVFETLRTLQDEGKIVGVISHVEELQEHIPLHILVSQTEQGSLIQ